VRRGVGCVNVLHIIDTLNNGGTENRCLEIVSGLDRTRFKGHLIYLNGDGPLRNRLSSIGVEHQEIRIRSFMKPDFLKKLANLSGYMKRQCIKVVQTYGLYSNIPGILAARLAAVPVIVASRRDMGQFGTPTQRRVEQWLWHFADRVVVNATAINDALVRCGIPAEKLVVIPNGVACHPLPPSMNNEQTLTPKVGMVANFRRQKDHVTFLKAAALVLARKPQVLFVLVGSGPYEQDVRRYAEEQGLGDHVMFCGTRWGRDLHQILQSLTVSVLSSHGNEGLPNVVLEGMAVGKPVVATDVGGTREAVEDGVTGFLVPPRDPRALAEKILWLLEHPDAAEKMGLEGRGKVENLFGLSRMQQSFGNLYLDLLHEKRLSIV
jgi:L-malate glycosyltransferase